MITRRIGVPFLGFTDVVDTHIEQALEHCLTPGAAVSVAMGDEIVFARGYGVSEIGRGHLVDEQTVFGLGSISKTFTAAIVARFVDRGLINWDDNVVDHLPSFRLADPWISANVTVRDILTHRVGLDEWENNFPWMFGGLTRKEFVARLRHLGPRERFRDCCSYSNALFNVLGEMLEAVTGNSWEELVGEEVFAPLKMTRSISGHDKLVPLANLAPYWGGRAPYRALRGELGLLPGIANVATPHGPDRSGNQVIYPWHHQQVTAAATNVASTAHDMGLYMIAHLRGATFLKPHTLREMFKPQNLHAPREGMQAMGLGWFICDRKGTSVLTHGGGQVGYTSLTSIVPSQNIGVTVLLNDDFASRKTKPLLSLISSALVDAALGLPPDASERALIQTLANGRSAMVEKDVIGETSQIGERRVVEPELPLDRYAGSYTHSANGRLDVVVSENKLFFEFAPLIAGELVHENGERFRLRFDTEHFHNHNLILRFCTEMKPQADSLTLTGLPTANGYQSATKWIYSRS